MKTNLKGQFFERVFLVEEVFVVEDTNRRENEDLNQKCS